MVYKASLDLLAKIMTAIVFIILAVVGYMGLEATIASHGHFQTIFFYSGLFLFLVVIILICYYYAPQSYIVDSSDLFIVRYAGNVKIKLSDIAQVVLLPDNEVGGMVRTFGVGGLFGYYGKYYSFKMGSLTLYTTQRKNRILIITRQGQKMLITPDDRKMSEKLQSH